MAFRRDERACYSRFYGIYSLNRVVPKTTDFMLKYLCNQQHPMHITTVISRWGQKIHSSSEGRSKVNKKETRLISEDMTILDIVSDYPETESVFKSYDQKIGECICCRKLFDTLRETADCYALDLTALLNELNSSCIH